MSDNEHAKAIRRATSTTSMVLADRWSRDSKDRVRLQMDSIERHADALAAQLAEAERQRDWHRDDAAMVRRERDAEAKRLVTKLAETEARARLAEGRLSAAIAFIRSRDGTITIMDTTIDGDGHDPVERCSLPESDEGGE